VRRYSNGEGKAGAVEWRFEFGEEKGLQLKFQYVHHGCQRAKSGGGALVRGGVA